MAKELKEGNRQNLVRVLQQEDQLNLPEAVNRAVAMCNAEIQAFLNPLAILSIENDNDELAFLYQRKADHIRINLEEDVRFPTCAQ